MDLIKKIYDVTNNPNGKLYLNTNLDIKEYIVEKINGLIKQINTIELQYQEWNVWLENKKEIFKNFIF